MQNDQPSNEIARNKNGESKILDGETKQEFCCGPACCNQSPVDIITPDNSKGEEISTASIVTAGIHPSDIQKAQQLKDIVRKKYSEIAMQDAETNQASCCGSTCCSTDVVNIMTDDYSEVEGYQPDADLGLGCGLPTKFARIQKGDTVIDLGSGAGNDAFIARLETGENGRVIGIDFTPSMIEKARKNSEKMGFKNVEFIQGDIENIPLTENIADVIVSNCVLNLVPNKDGVFKEIFRLLKPGGHFSISDIVLIGDLPESLQKDAEMYAGCVAGAIQKDKYLNLITTNGFTNISVQKEKVIEIPDDILTNYLKGEELANFKKGSTGIVSITVYAEKIK